VDDLLPDPIPIDTAAVAAWSAVLDDLQSHVDHPGAALRYWAPPPNLGRLPESLMDRAQTLVAAQSAAVEQLTVLRGEVAAEIAALAPPRKNATAVYLDVVA
jgi:hypothetical protein